METEARVTADDEFDGELLLLEYPLDHDSLQECLTLLTPIRELECKHVERSSDYLYGTQSLDGWQCLHCGLADRHVIRAADISGCLSLCIDCHHEYVASVCDMIPVRISTIPV